MNTSTLPTPQATTVLQLSALPALRRLAVQETDCEVIITGTVSSYYLKQMAQEALRPVLDGRRLRNRVIVEAN